MRRKFLNPDLVKTVPMSIVEEDGAVTPLWDATQGAYFNPAKIAPDYARRLLQEKLARSGHATQGGE